MRGKRGTRLPTDLRPGPNRAPGRPTLRQTVLFGILGGLTFVLKAALAPLPNVEPVSLLVMLFAVTFGGLAVYPIYIYVLLELGLYGLHLWSVSYLYLWLALAAGAWLMRPCRSPFRWALLSGGFGLLFGLLCAPVYLAAGGPAFALSWWLSGIPFDLLHGAANFILALLLFAPLRTLLERLARSARERTGGEQADANGLTKPTKSPPRRGPRARR